MTDIQFLAILGTVWVAPHCRFYDSIIIGSTLLAVAAGRGLGWI